MNKFAVDLSVLTSEEEKEKRLSQELAQIKEGVDSVRRNLKWEVQSKASIDKQLQCVDGELQREITQMNSMASVLRSVREAYTQTEQKICGYESGETAAVSNAVAASAVASSAANTAFLGALKEGEVTLGDGTTSGGSANSSQALLDALQNGVSASGEQESSAYHYQNDNLDLKLGKGRMEGSAYAGLFTTGPDGQMRFDPRVNADFGVSYSALELNAQGQLGDENLGVHGSGELKVGSIGANGSLNASLYDEDGNFNPEGAVNLGAEAILLSAAVTGGVDLAGTKVDATAELNIGVGAHANVGFKDGKLTFDVGASLGIGFDVKLDIDCSGTVNAVSGFVKSIFGW